MESVLKKKRKAVGRICRKERFEAWNKSDGVMSGESMEPMGEVPLVGLGELELENL